MVAILDSNHLRELVSASDLGHRFRERISRTDTTVFTCIIVVEESMQGWLALLHRSEPEPDQVGAYERMQESLSASVALGVLPFDADAATVFLALRKELRRVGAMDLKIAAICLVHDAVLLTRNLVDFSKVPGLRVENWLD
jgi:tRNA(fMet)-specific endonuclease VapC